MAHLHCFSIAGLPIRMDSEQCLPMTDHFRPFQTDAEPVITGVFRRVEQLPEWDRTVLYTGNCFHAHPGQVRSYFDAPRDLAPYAVSRTDHDRGLVQVSYLEKGAHCVSQLDNSFFHLGFEGLLIRHDRICFHASCIRTEHGGILFSGPSGIGKSTQADLWCSHRGAVQINGDRPILQKTAEGFRAWGSPYAGSSHCYVNDWTGVRAMVFLAKAPENRIRRLAPGEAFRKIYGQLTMYAWDREFVERGTDLALELTASVPCYELACLPDETAVQCLEQKLKEEVL